jgi:hypothetical protein
LLVAAGLLEVGVMLLAVVAVWWSGLRRLSPLAPMLLPLEQEGPLGRLVVIPFLRAILPLAVDRAILRAKAILVAVAVAGRLVVRRCNLHPHQVVMGILVVFTVAVAQEVLLTAMKVALHTRVHCLAMITLEAVA